MTDDNEDEEYDFTVATLDEVKTERIEHVVTEPVWPRGGSTEEENDDE
jgi:hypothetical protein